MLAVFHKSVMKCPDELKNTAESEAYFALNDDELLQHFFTFNPDAFTFKIGTKGFLSLSDHPDSRPPRRFSCEGDIFCMFHGHIENEDDLREKYDLTKVVDECNIIRLLCPSLRDTYPYDEKVLSSMQGKFAFIVYDNSSNFILVAVDADGSLPFYWGTDPEEKVVLSTEIDIVKKACGNSFGPFPHGCFFTSDEGLESFKYPGEKLNAKPLEDNFGQPTGVTFAVAGDEKKMELRKRKVDAAGWVYD